MVNKWEIYVCHLDPTQGSEQKGTRSVLIISTDAVNHNLPVSTVIPLSGVKAGAKIYPTEVLLPTNISGLSKESVLMLQQIRTVAHTRLTTKISTITDEYIRNKILGACCNYFDL